MGPMFYFRTKFVRLQTPAVDFSCIYAICHQTGMHIQQSTEGILTF